MGIFEYSDPDWLSQRVNTGRIYLSAETQQDEHEEEKQRPEWWDGQQRQGFWVGDEGQAWPVVSHLGHVHAQVLRHEPQDGEDDKAGIDTCCTVCHTDDDAISVQKNQNEVSEIQLKFEIQNSVFLL